MFFDVTISQHFLNKKAYDGDGWGMVINVRVYGIGMGGFNGIIQR